MGPSPSKGRPHDRPRARRRPWPMRSRPDGRRGPPGAVHRHRRACRRAAGDGPGGSNGKAQPPRGNRASTRVRSATASRRSPRLHPAADEVEDVGLVVRVLHRGAGEHDGPHVPPALDPGVGEVVERVVRTALAASVLEHALKPHHGTRIADLRRREDRVPLRTVVPRAGVDAGAWPCKPRAHPFESWGLHNGSGGLSMTDPYAAWRRSRPLLSSKLANGRKRMATRHREPHLTGVIFDPDRQPIRMLGPA